MSNALAIAGVTAVIRDLLNDGLINHDAAGVVGSTVTVTALAPDRIATSNGQEVSQLNIFLYAVSNNPAYSNSVYPSMNSSGQRTANAPLSLDLHYLVTAFGADDLHSDILLGYAMQLMHEHSVLPRQTINTALSPSPNVGVTLPPALRALENSGLADQIELINISPVFMTAEEMSKIWTSFQTHYRLSMAYQVSVVLIESEQQAVSPLPVLSRGQVDPISNLEGGIAVNPNLLPLVPTITELEYAGGQSSTRPNEILTIIGYYLNGSSALVRFRHMRLEQPLEVNIGVIGEDNAESSVAFTVPNVPADWIAGQYALSLHVIPPGEIESRTTNEMAVQIAPVMTLPPVSVTRDGGSGDVTVVLKCAPVVRPFQEARLVVGSQSVLAEEHAVQTNQLTFVIANLPATTYKVRLRIDGVESWLIDKSAEPPVFFADQEIVVPA